MEDIDHVTSALLAYTSAVVTEEASSVRSVDNVKDALSSNVLLAMAGIDLPRHYDNLQVFKIVYHRLITAYDFAYLLPCPSLHAIDLEEPVLAEFIKFYSIILLAQAVWSPENSRYVRVIQGLDQKYQECLKEVIEKALASLPEESPEGSFVDKGDDDTLREAELVYRIQKHASGVEESSRRRDQPETAQESPSPGPEAGKADQFLSKRKKRSTGASVDPSTFTLGDSGSDSEDDLAHTAPSGDVGPLARSMAPIQRVTANERIKELEIERLQAELNDKADELRMLESQLEESRRNVQAYAHRIAELEASVEEIDRLRDELEIHRHATEKLRKSENVVDKLKKKLDAVADVRSEMLALESQLKTLRDENAQWESKYTALIRSRKGNSGSTASSGIPVSESQVSELSMRVQQLEVALHAKEVEVGQLREMSFERDQSGPEDDTSSLASDEQNASPIKYRKQAQPLVSGSMASSDAIQTIGPSKARSPESTTTRTRLLDRIAELEELLAAASVPSKTDGDKAGHRIRASATGTSEGESGRANGNVLELEREISRLRDALAETDLRYRTEKLLMLKAWTDLGQRAMKMSAGDNGRNESGSVGTGSAGRPVELSWASRVRRQMHSVPPRKL